MKALLAALTLFVSANAFASLPATMDCDSGNMGEDSYVYVNIGATKIDMGMHESNYPIARSKTVTRGNTIAILDRTIKGSAEGESFQVQASALLVYDYVRSVLNVTLIEDGHTLISNKELTCK
jgi:hypothetical protein